MGYIVQTFHKNKIIIMQKKIVECVPNFSEGRDMGIIRQITDAIELLVIFVP